MEQYFSVLRTCPLFTDVENHDLSALLRCLGARVEFFDKKYTIFAEGSPARYIGIVLSGSAQVFQLDYYGNRSILAEVLPSELFAEAFACADVSDLPISVVASEPCEVMLIDCHRILDEKGSKPLSAQIHFLKPIPYEEYKDLKTPDLAALVKSRIQETIDNFA